MKATAKNIATFDIAQVPAKMKADHKEIVGIAQFYGQDKDITEAIDNYVGALNRSTGKAKRNPLLNKRQKNIDFSKMENNVFEIVRVEGHAPGYEIRLIKGGNFSTWHPTKEDAENVLQASHGWVSKAEPKKKAPSKAKRTTAQKAKAAAKLTKMRTDGVGGKYANMTRNQVLATAQAYNATRTLGAQIVDGGIDHKKRLSPTPENLVRWMKEPGKFDLIGVDNFKENDPTADLKIKKEIFWNRLGIGRKR